MLKDHPYLYPYSKEDARRSKELDRWQESFAHNVQCARDIESAIRGNYENDTIREGCAQSVLNQYGFKRVNFVLANSVKQTGGADRIAIDNLRWAQAMYIPGDGKHNRYYTVDTAAPLLDAFVRQAREAYQALGLFGPEHCAGDRSRQDFTGKVLVLSPNTLRETCWKQHDQLWYAHDGFGCRPNAIGRSIRSTCLGDGEMTRWNRSDFTGVLDEQYLPDWAREKLEELRGPMQEQNSGPTMGGMA